MCMWSDSRWWTLNPSPSIPAWSRQHYLSGLWWQMCTFMQSREITTNDLSIFLLNTNWHDSYKVQNRPSHKCAADQAWQAASDAQKQKLIKHKKPAASTPHQSKVLQRLIMAINNCQGVLVAHGHSSQVSIQMNLCFHWQSTSVVSVQTPHQWLFLANRKSVLCCPQHLQSWYEVISC